MGFFTSKKKKISTAVYRAVAQIEEKIDKETSTSISVNFPVAEFDIKPKMWQKFKEELVAGIKQHFVDNGQYVHFREAQPSRFTVSWKKKFPWKRGERRPTLLTRQRREKGEQ